MSSPGDQFLSSFELHFEKIELVVLFLNRSLHGITLPEVLELGYKQGFHITMSTQREEKLTGDLFLPSGGAGWECGQALS
jgi:hypothetical protein